MLLVTLDYKKLMMSDVAADGVNANVTPSVATDADASSSSSAMLGYSCLSVFCFSAEEA